MKLSKRFLAILMVVLMIFSVNPISTSAASYTYLQTVEANVKIRSTYKKTGDVKRTVTYTGTVLRAVSTKVNSSGNLWYKLDTGYWVFSGNVTKHYHSYSNGSCTGRECGYRCGHSSYTGGYCNTCGYHWPYSVSSFSGTYEVVNSSGAKIWSRPYSKNSTHHYTASYGTLIYLNGKTTNQEKHLWYRLTNGYWVYSENVTKHNHKYTGGICNTSGCGYEWPYSVSSFSGTYEVVNTSGAKIWSRPYSNKSTHHYTASYGSVLYLNGKTVNQENHTWYRLSNGYWVYSENVSKHTHKYTGGICNTSGCAYEWPYSVSAYSGTFVVTNTSGAKIWSRPYSKNSTHKYTSTNGSVLNVVGKTTNQESHLWYKLDNGYWVFSENVKQRYNIVYNANGGSNTPASQNVISGNYLKLTSSKPTRTGYIFKGWSTSSGGSVNYSSGSSYKFTKNTTLYAVWSKCSHSSYTGGYCNACNYEYSCSITSFNGTFVVTNSKGAKIWSRPYSKNSTHKYTSTNGSVLNVVGKTTNEENHLWYKLDNGYWVYSENVKQRYNISYNANGGSGTPASQNVISGNYLKISSSKPNRAGYIFKGWATSSGGSVKYSSGKSYKFTKDTTLYAVWSKCSHSSYTGGYCNTCNYEYSCSITSFNGTFVVTNSKGGKIWSRPYSKNSTHKYTSAYGSVLKVVAKAKNEEKNLWYKLDNGYWVYSKNVTQKFKVTYNANGGSGAPSSINFIKGNSIIITNTKPNRAGYIFKGWSTSSGGNVKYTSGKSYKFTKDTTLYAVWSKCSHPSYIGGVCTKCKYVYPLKETAVTGKYVVINKNGAPVWSIPYSKGSAKQITKYKQNTEINVVASVRNQNNKLWYKLNNGYWIYSGNIAKESVLVFNANGGTNTPSNKYFIPGKNVTIPGIKPKKRHYIFKGWSTTPSGEVSYKVNKKYTFNKDTTLYAVWENTNYIYGDLLSNNNINSVASIPGLDENFVPQGICYCESYGVYLVSGYVSTGEASRIYLINPNTNSYKRINLEKTPDEITKKKPAREYTGHAGGIATDGSNVWVSSGGNSTSDGRIYHTTISAILNVKNNGKLQFDKYFYVPTKGSGLFCDGKYLWVFEFYEPTGNLVKFTHHIDSNHSWACAYEIDSINDNTYNKKTTVTPDIVLSIPDKVQGMSITDDGKVVFSCSYGRNNNSHLLVYNHYSNWNTKKVKINGVQKTIYIANNFSIINSITMPTLLEGLDYHNGKLYFLFESGAKKYSDALENYSYIFNCDF